MEDVRYRLFERLVRLLERATNLLERQLGLRIGICRIERQPATLEVDIQSRHLE